MIINIFNILKKGTIIVQDLSINMSIGIYDFEKTTLQPVRISLECDYITKINNNNSDNPTYVCYKQLTDRIIEHSKTKHIDLVEQLAEDIAKIALDFLSVYRVHVTILKPNAISITKGVGVKITRSKSPLKVLTKILFKNNK